MSGFSEYARSIGIAGLRRCLPGCALVRNALRSLLVWLGRIRGVIVRIRPNVGLAGRVTWTVLEVRPLAVRSGIVAVINLVVGAAIGGVELAVAAAIDIEGGGEGDRGRQGDQDESCLERGDKHDSQ